MNQIAEDHPIILFDGVCNLCNGFVQFMIERDPQGHFRFASLQSEVGQTLLKKYQLPTDTIDTVVLIQNGRAYLRSDVPLNIATQLGGFWPVFGLFRILPSSFRDMVYNFVAARRYSWFGENDHCMMPTPELKSRFLT